VATEFPTTTERRSLVRFTLRLLVVYLVVTLVVLLAGRRLLEIALPAMEVAVNVLQQDFSGSLAMVQRERDWVIEMQPMTVRFIPLGNEISVRQFRPLPRCFTHVDHTLVPIVLLLTALIAWPTRKRREAVVRVVLGGAAAAFLLFASAPLLLVGQAQLALVGLAKANGGSMSEPMLLTLMIFMETGGRWLLPIVLAVACIGIARSSTYGVDPAVPEPAQPREQPSAPVVFPPAGG
jgi:TRAP-type uncharacterized transport system fused permease subunit